MSLLRAFSSFMRRWSPATIIVVALLIVAGLSILSYAIGQNFSSALFFLIPIALVTWYVGRVSGVIVSVLSGTGLLVTDVTFRTGEHGVLAVWNALFPFLFFIVFVILMTLLKDSLAREALLSRTDPLTGLCNRRFFNELASSEMSKSRRYRHPISLAYADADNFKLVNDSMGHDEGDEVLLLIARTLKENLRGSDIIGRMGGDEFVVLLPETGAGQAEAAMGKLRLMVNESAALRGWPVTLSIGVVTFAIAPGTLDDMIKEADALMYTIKETSKDGIASRAFDNDDSALEGQPVS
ncbi:MAG: GGDEF domain-containing protein [Candidatus Geothermincolia bacterium]